MDTSSDIPMRCCKERICLRNLGMSYVCIFQSVKQESGYSDCQCHAVLCFGLGHSSSENDGDGRGAIILITDV